MKNVSAKCGSQKKRFMQGMFLAVMAAIFAGMLYYRGLPFAVAFAGPEEAASSAVEVVIKILDVICIIVGAFALLFGIVNVAIAKLNDQGPKQNEALISTAVGVALILMGSVILPNLQPTFVKLVQSAVQ